MQAFLLERPQTPPSPFSLLPCRDPFPSRTAVRYGEGVNSGGNITSDIYGESSGRQGEQHWGKKGVVRQEEEEEDDGQSRGISGHGNGDAGKHEAGDALTNASHVPNGAFGATGTNGLADDAEGGSFDRRRENPMKVPPAGVHNGNHNHISTNTHSSSSSSIKTRPSTPGADREGLGHDFSNIPLEELCRSPGGQWTTRRRHGEHVIEDNQASSLLRDLDEDRHGSSLQVR